MPEELLDRVAELLRARGERMTAPRRAVLTALTTVEDHPTAEDVIDEVARVDPSVHRASVYRTLEALVGLGVVQHVHISHGRTTYHLMPSHGPHPHAQCRSCGAVYDLPDDLLDHVAGRLGRETGFVLDTGHAALSGTCGNCLGTTPPTSVSGSLAGAPHRH